MGPIAGIGLQKVFENLSSEGLDLMNKLLNMNYEKRITAAAALEHPYFAKLHLPKDEPVRDPVNSREFEFE